VRLLLLVDDGVEAGAEVGQKRKAWVVPNPCDKVPVRSVQDSTSSSPRCPFLALLHTHFPGYVMFEVDRFLSLNMPGIMGALLGALLHLVTSTGNGGVPRQQHRDCVPLKNND
jgi:hypothetical protein